MSLRLRPLACLLLAAPLCAQTPTPAAPLPDSPVGNWIAEHPHPDALELWWSFEPDGNVTATAGAIVRSTYSLNGNTLTIAPTPGSPGGSFDIHFRDGKLFATANVARSPTLEYTRIDPPTSAETALVGTWRVSNAPHATDPDQEALRNRMMSMITAYRADASYETRLPVDTIHGHWSAADHTYTLRDHKPLRFSRTPSGLTLALPPDGKDSHAYHRDTFPTP